jgi:ElaB/YqjD/DUF883 family membrane-anchored ribosome-binding protein
MTHTIPETKAQARAAADRLAGKARDTLDAAKSAMRDSIDQVSERTRKAKDWASDRMDAARDMPAAMANRGADYIRERPYATLAVALAVGYVVGVVLTGSMRKAPRDRGELERY